MSFAYVYCTVKLNVLIAVIVLFISFTFCKLCNYKYGLGPVAFLIYVNNVVKIELH